MSNHILHNCKIMEDAEARRKKEVQEIISQFPFLSTVGDTIALLIDVGYRRGFNDGVKTATEFVADKFEK